MKTRNKIAISLLMLALQISMCWIIVAAAAKVGFALATVNVFLFVVFAPMTEEYAKRIAIKLSFPLVYTFIFAIAELICYMFSLGIPVIAARVLPFVLHFF